MVIAGKTTYGLASRTSLNFLSTSDDLNREKVFPHCVYMHWAIITAHPGTMATKKQLVAGILQQVAEQYPQEASEENMQKLKIFFAAIKDPILEICRSSNTTTVSPMQQWYKNWQQHCTDFFLEDASPEAFAGLFLVLKDTMGLLAPDLLAVVYFLSETLHCEPVVPEPY
jgi:hypothetical protein